MMQDEHIGYYECDDEGEDGNKGYQEYYEDEQEHYPHSSGNKNSVGLYENPDQVVHHNPSAFQAQNDPRWLTSEAENISGSSEGRNFRKNQNKFDNNLQHNPFGNEQEKFQPDRDKYFSNKELLTITVEIGNGEQENIVIMEGETAETVAGKFCDKYDMNQELRMLFTEQIAQNIEQAIQEMNENDETPVLMDKVENDQFNDEKLLNSDSAPIEHVSTGLEVTPNHNVFSNPENNKNVCSSTPKVEKHSYSTPGPILINPNRGDKRTLPKQKKGSRQVKANKSFTHLGDMTPNKPMINSHSVLLANKRKIPGNNVYSRLHSEAVNKQKKKGSKNSNGNVSYEASTIINGGIPAPKSAKKRGRDLISDSFTQRNRTPNNYGEKLYQNGLKRMEEKERKSNREKIEKELKQYESLTFQPHINHTTRHQRRNSKKLEDQLIEKGKKTHDKIEKKRSEMMFEKQHRYSFKPRINKKSERIIQERSRQFLEESSRMLSSPHVSQNYESSYMTSAQKLNKFTLLYDDAMKRKQRKDEIYSR